LRALAVRWRILRHRAREAQTFLNQLFACYGTDRFASGALFEDSHASVGIIDRRGPAWPVAQADRLPPDADGQKEYAAILARAIAGTFQ